MNTNSKNDLTQEELELLKNDFHNDMKELYDRSKKELKYNATRFIQMIGDIGGYETAKRLINKPGISDGFAILWEYKRKDLSVENLVLQEKYAPLFTDEEKKKCQELLDNIKQQNRRGLFLGD